jgi:hypothetical protein
MSSRNRVLDLACDRALWGLDPAQDMELASALPPGVEIDPSLALTAAAIALSQLEIDEQLPAHLAERAFAAAMSSAPARSVGRAGTIPMAGHPHPGMAGRPGATPMPASTPGGARPSFTPLTPLAFMPTANDGPRSITGAGRPSVAPGQVTSSSGGGLTPKRSPLAWMGWVAAAACLALAVGTYVLSRRTIEGGGTVAKVEPTAAEKRDRMIAEAKDAVRISWTPTEDVAAKGSSGEVVWSNARQEGYMTFRALSANDPTKEQYQLWIFDAERDEKYPVDGGVFDVGAAQAGPGGEVVVPIVAKVAVKTPKLFAVTIEKPGGVVVSKRERIAVTAAVKG